jgi:glycosyltransferase involved in cell wall biosynthesis
MTDFHTIPIGFAITELDPGGAERAFTQLVTRLDRSVWTPTVYCLSGRGELAETITDTGIPVHFLDAGGKWDLGLIGRFSSRLKEDRPQILQTFLHHSNIAGRIAAWRAGVPIVVSGIRVSEERHPMRLRLDRWTQHFVNTNVCVSPSVAKFSRESGGISSDKLRVIPNGVEVERFSTATSINWKSLGLPADAEVILAVGRLDEQKRPLLAFQACLPLFEDNSLLHLTFAGIGPHEAKINELANQHGVADRVHCLGTRDDVPELMRGSKLLLHTSAWEGSPNVILEALAAGLPVIATENPGNRDALRGGEWGFLMLDYAPDITDFLDSILNSEEAITELKELASRAQSALEKGMTWQATVSSYEDLYHELLSQR